jgi:hypothetical protein
MEKLLLVAALACQPGDRLIDLSGKLPRGLQFMDLVVSVEPFYTRFDRRTCCAGRSRVAAVLRVLLVDSSPYGFNISFPGRTSPRAERDCPTRSMRAGRCHRCWRHHLRRGVQVASAASFATGTRALTKVEDRLFDRPLDSQTRWQDECFRNSAPVE